METRHTPAAVTLAALGCLLLVIQGCDSKVASQVAPAMPVGVVTIARQDVPLSIEMIGTTMGTQDVPIRARVEGFLETMEFQEGRFVEKGTLLYTIDAQPFQARMLEAQSSLTAAQTNLVKAASDLSRIRPLAEMDAVSQQDLDAAVAQEAAASASVQAAEASVELAKIEYSYTRIHAPIRGLIGLSKAKPGEFVGRDPNPVVLNTLSDIDPIRVRFSISEREYLFMARTYLNSEKSPKKIDGEEQALDLDLLLADGSQHKHSGHVVASAQTINPETGTYTLEAAFPNPNNLLLPGQFARVRAPYTTLKDAVVVPRRALVDLQGNFRVYVIKTDNTIEVRDVSVGPVKGDLQVIESGLDGGETIVVEGLQKVRAGMLVQPQAIRETAPVTVMQET